MPLPLIPIVSAIAGSSLLQKIINNNAGTASTIGITQTMSSGIQNIKTQMQASTQISKITNVRVNSSIATPTAGQTVTYPAMYPDNPTLWQVLDYYNEICEFYISLGAPDLRGYIQFGGLNGSEASLTQQGTNIGQAWFQANMPTATNACNDYITTMGEAIYYQHFSTIEPEEMGETQNAIMKNINSIKLQNAAKEQKIANEIKNYKFIFSAAGKILGSV